MSHASHFMTSSSGSFHTYMTEDHGLANGDGSIDVRESLELLVLTVTVDVVLFDVGQRLFLSA